MNEDSVTIWLRQFAKGDQVAARKLWDRYGPSLIEVARRRFPGAFPATGDEEDLVQSVFRVLWTGAKCGRFDKLRNREELWWLLLTITRRKAINRQAYHVRKKRRRATVPLDEVIGGSDLSSRAGALADPDQPPPALILILDEEQRRLLALLRDDVLRSIALRKLEGYTHDEIAKELGVTSRTVVRKVNLIRERWIEELDE